MLGQPASWQTVCRPSDFTRFWSSVYCGPIFARVLIHAGLRSIGVSALRTSRRSSLRPAGTACPSRRCPEGGGGLFRRLSHARHCTSRGHGPEPAARRLPTVTMRLPFADGRLRGPGRPGAPVAAAVDDGRPARVVDLAAGAPDLAPGRQQAPAAARRGGPGRRPPTAAASATTPLTPAGLAPGARSWWPSCPAPTAGAGSTAPGAGRAGHRGAPHHPRAPYERHGRERPDRTSTRRPDEPRTDRHGSTTRRATTWS